MDGESEEKERGNKSRGMRTQDRVKQRRRKKKKMMIVDAASCQAE